MRDYNSQAFTPDEVEKGLHMKLVEYLLSYNKEATENYNDIHITSDGFCVIVEWANIPYDSSYGGKFVYVDDDEVVMLRRELPDNSCCYYLSEEEYKEELNNWLKENPGYEKNEYGRWFKKEEVL